MKRAVLLFAMLVAAPRAALACPVCFGQSDSPLASATNLGIIAMLGIIGGVLACFAAFMVHLNRRAKLVDAAGVAHGHAQAGLGRTNPQEGTA